MFFGNEGELAQTRSNVKVAVVLGVEGMEQVVVQPPQEEMVDEEGSDKGEQDEEIEEAVVEKPEYELVMDEQFDLFDT